MKQVTTLLSLLIWIYAIGQSKSQKKPKNSHYNNVTELFLLNEIDSSNLVTTYKVEAGFEGLLLQLKNDGTYKETSYSCDGQEPVNSGTWQFEKGKLKLGAGNTKSIYEFVIFRDVLFLVAPKDKETFTKEFQRALKIAIRDQESNSKIRFSASVLRSMHDLYYYKWLD